MTLDEALSRAFAGDTAALYALLCRGSGLPGERLNLPLARAFADACASPERGPALAKKMASLSADEAPGSTALEMLPVCGVLAAGACAVRQPQARPAMLQVLHDACDDLRFRVRDAVPLALAELAKREGNALLGDLEPFMEGYFHAAAVLAMLATTPELNDGEQVSALLAKTLVLIDRSPRAAERWPGYKALLVALEQSIAPLALRVGTPVLDVVAGFRTEDPHLRALLVRALEDKRLRARLGAERDRAERSLTAQDKGPRDPRSLPRPTRRRGGRRR
jgi:hypothetical protein